MDDAPPPAPAPSGEAIGGLLLPPDREHHRKMLALEKTLYPQPMIIAPPIFVTSSRTTHMDVMVTTNTSRRYVEHSERGARRAPPGRGGKLKPRCSLPYELGPAPPGRKSKSTPAQRLNDDIARRRTNEAMHEVPFGVGSKRPLGVAA